MKEKTEQYFTCVGDASKNYTSYFILFKLGDDAEVGAEVFQAPIEGQMVVCCIH